MAFTTEYETPTWRSSMSFISWAQMVGNPSAPVPAAPPRSAPPAFSTERRDGPFFEAVFAFPEFFG